MRRSLINGYWIEHDFPYDPAYGYKQEELLQIKPPKGPDGFKEYWTERFQRVCEQPATLKFANKEDTDSHYVSNIQYNAADGFMVGGWLLYPKKKNVRRGFIIGHGYGGREQPDYNWPFDDAAMLFPCARGFHRSAHPDYPSDAMRHVIAGIENREKYLIGKCIEDLWSGVGALLKHFPEIKGNINFIGCSFGGGLGALSVPWDNRINAAQFTIPTFGCQPLRLQLPTGGSGAAVQVYAKRHPQTLEETLCWYDAATAASYLSGVPTHCSCALFDPAVAPPGQFGIHNAIHSDFRQLFVRTTGHHDFPGIETMLRSELQDIVRFFDFNNPD